MMKKVLLILLAICMVASLFTGCGAAKSSKDTVTLIEGAEPETIDPGLNSTTDGATYILHMFEGLTKVGKTGKTEPGVAKSWDISSDSLTYTFHLRDNAKWSDGQVVKAQDFEYAWKRALDPKTASSYAYQLYYIKNAEAYNAPKAGATPITADQVGVKATDDKTLVVTLNSPTAYFIDLTNFPTYMPLRKDMLDKYADKWTQKPESYIGNGAYKMTAWKHNEVIETTKNENYWDNKSIAIKNINWKLVEDDNVALNAFDAGEVDASLNNHVPVTEVKNLLDAGKLKVYPLLGTYYLDFSVNKPIVNDVKVRKALSLAIDRQLIVDTVTKAGQLPAVGFVPPGTPGADPKKDFRSEAGGGDFIQPTAQIDEAKKLLSDAGYPDGKGFPTLELIYNTSTTHQAVMESVQEQWKKNLGIDVKISNMEFKTLIPLRTAHDFTIARDGWIGDYNDPMTFLDLFTTPSGQNSPAYSNATYDKAVADAKASIDPKVRMAAMHTAEKQLMDDMPIIPIYFYVTYQMENPDIKDMYVSPLGFVFMQYAYIK